MVRIIFTLRSRGIQSFNLVVVFPWCYLSLIFLITFRFNSLPGKLLSTQNLFCLLPEIWCLVYHVPVGKIAKQAVWRSAFLLNR